MDTLDSVLFLVSPTQNSKEAEFFKMAPEVPVKTETHAYKLSDAQKALDDLKQGNFTGAAVLVP